MKFNSHLTCLLALLAFSFSANAQRLTGSTVQTSEGDLVIHPVSHASFVMAWDEKTVFVDPVGGIAAYDGLPRPDMIILTDIHGDHLDMGTLENLADNAVIIAPDAVSSQFNAALADQTLTLPNGAIAERLGITLEAIPMYNLTEERLQFHDKGRGNGYVVTFADTRVYISGDTEDIPEMRALQNINVAFVCFNLPYTMTENQAADAVNAFSPDIVYPYHYQGSDLALFTGLVDDGIEVRNGDWY